MAGKQTCEGKTQDQTARSCDSSLLHLSLTPSPLCQVRLCAQFESGQQFPVHLVSSPKKAKLSPGPMRIHLQNLRFSLVAGLPPTLVHTWDLVDLRSVKTLGYEDNLTPF